MLEIRQLIQKLKIDNTFKKRALFLKMSKALSQVNFFKSIMYYLKTSSTRRSFPKFQLFWRLLAELQQFEKKCLEVFDLFFLTFIIP